MLIKKKKNNQIETGFAYQVSATGLTLITSSFGSGMDKIFALFSKETESNNMIQLIAGFALLLVGMWMGYYVKNKLCVINLLGTKQRRIEDFRKDIGLNQFEYKEREIDLSEFFLKMDRECYEKATDLIKKRMETFYSESKEVNKGYTGEAPIPLIMFAGQCDRGAPIKEYYEYQKFEQRLTKLESCQKKRWPTKKEEFPELKLKESLDSLNLEEAEEIVLGVSVTMEIKKHQVQQFNAPFIELQVDEPKHNAIQFKEQVHNYSKKIFDLIIELSNAYPKLRKIHLVMSCQSSLAYELGKKITPETYLKETIIYHYKNNSIPAYKWGISFNEEGTKYVEC